MSHVRHMAVFLFTIGAAAATRMDLLEESGFVVGICMWCGDNELCTVHGLLSSC